MKKAPVKLCIHPCSVKIKQ